MRSHKAIEAFRNALRNRFGAALHEVVVFGSVARDTATESSDIDVMVILDHPDESVDWRTERDVRSVAFQVELDHDVVFDLKTVDRADLSGSLGHTPFMERVLAEGVTV